MHGSEHRSEGSDGRKHHVHFTGRRQGLRQPAGCKQEADRRDVRGGPRGTREVEARAGGRAGRLLLGGGGRDDRHEGRDRARARVADGATGSLWRGRAARLRGARPLHDRDRGAGAGRHRPWPEGWLRPLRDARAARRGLHARAVELPLPHCRQLGRPGDHGRQRGGAEARRLDAARRRAVSGGIRPGEAAEGCVPASRAEPHAGGRRHRRRAGQHGVLHRLGGRRESDGRSVGRPVHQCRPRARRQGPGLRPARRRHVARRREPGRRRLLQLRAELLRHRADLRPQEGVGRLPRRIRRSDQEVRAGLAARGDDHTGTHGEGGGGDVRAEADRVGGARRRQDSRRSQVLHHGQGRARPTWRRRS